MVDDLEQTPIEASSTDDFTPSNFEPCIESNVCDTPGTSTSVLLQTHGCDIGRLLHFNVKRDSLSRDDTYLLLKAECDPNSSIYPRTRYESGLQRQFQPSWVKKFPWLHYSKHSDGVFCRACALFAPLTVRGQSLGQFVISPFRAWMKALAKIGEHGKLDYHQASMTTMQEFIFRYENPSMAVHTLLDNEIQKRMEENQAILEAIFKVVILCGKQGFALRGHRDDKIEWEDFDGNHGNFLELLHFRAETDDNLRRHLQRAPSNAKMTSKTIQNEVIAVIGNVIRNEILHEVKQAMFFSIIADEVTDVSSKEQLSLCIRYVYNNSISEVFLDFIEMDRITGAALAKAILDRLALWNLPLSHLRGQCYDGASNMSGARAGCKSIILNNAPKALYVHCAAHKLNLAIVSGCKIRLFRSTEGTIGEIARFFNFSPKRQHLLEEAISHVNPSSHVKKLKDACRTRWIERIDSYSVFLQLLPSLHAALRAIVSPSPQLGTNWNWDSDTLTKANGFLYQLESSQFLICFKVLLEVLSNLRGLTTKLQMQAIDVLYAYREVTVVIANLQAMRDEAETEFARLFEETTALGKQLHGEDFKLKQPRTSRQQVHRNNVPSASTEAYFRISLYNEFLSHVVLDLQDRFSSEVTSHATGLLHVMPVECIKGNTTDIPVELKTSVDYYSEDMPCVEAFPTEYRMWVRKWKQEQGTKEKLIDVFKECDAIAFPNIKVLLLIILTLPITSCESERSFSQLKLIKTSHRSTMSSDRLSGLSLMKINRSRVENIQTSKLGLLVDEFTKLHPRRMKLPCMLCD
jgi:hypothetical protein